MANIRQGEDRTATGPGRLRLGTRRLNLTALTLEALQAWVDGDPDALLRETGAVFEEPVGTPPLFAEDLPGFRDRMAETPSELGWWVWLLSRREDRRAVGVCGLGGRPDLHGVVVIGYAVYPRWEGLGYATEGTGAVVTWALSRPGVRVVRATVPIGNAGSVGVARKVGMVEVGRQAHPGLGDLAVYERRREA